MPLTTVPLQQGFGEWPAIARAALRFSPFRHHRIFSPEELTAIFHQHVAARLTSSHTNGSLLYADDSPVGLSLCSRQAWDSNYFGLPVAQLDCWATESAPTSDLRSLIGATLDAASTGGGPRLVTAGVDADNYAVVNALVSLNFQLLDIKRTYVCKLDRIKPAMHGHFRPRLFQESDRKLVEELLDSTRFQSRFTRDEHLSPISSGALYRRWMENLMALPESDREIYVVERHGKIIAAGGGRYRDLRPAGISCKYLTDGIFASSPAATGAYISIIGAVVNASRQKDCRFVELKVSGNNLAAIRVLQFLGYQEAGQQLAFHKHYPG